MLLKILTAVSMLTRSIALAAPAILIDRSHTLLHNLTDGPPYCTDSTDWIGPALNRLDCDRALNELLNHQVLEHEDQAFEFLAPGSTPSHTLQVIQTPIKIRVRTCTLAIAMLASFVPGSLPGEGAEVYPATDVASFRDVYFAVLGLSVHCTRRRGEPGWSKAGGRGAVGAFLWGTGSRIDVLVRGRRRLGKPLRIGHPPFLNGTAAE